MLATNSKRKETMVEMVIKVRKSETKQRKSGKEHNKICVTKLNSKEYN